jgi:hypothetical protein
MFEIFGRTRAEGPIGRDAFYAEALEPEDRLMFDRALAEAALGSFGTGVAPDYRCLPFLRCNSLHVRDLGEYAAAGGLYGTEQQPDDRVGPRCIGLRNSISDDGAAVSRHPAWTGAVSSDRDAVLVVQPDSAHCPRRRPRCAVLRGRPRWAQPARTMVCRSIPRLRRPLTPSRPKT